MKLTFSPSSPYARKVRIAAIELGFIDKIELVPTAGAVAAALEAFDGRRRMTLPMKDSPAARAINVGRIPDADRDQWH